MAINLDDYTLEELQDYLEAVETLYEDMRQADNNIMRNDEHRQQAINGCLRTINDIKRRIATFNIKRK
jgi:predicted house-cleaning noncanonical NTP pyrophosphatase (MazG superfamily)